MRSALLAAALVLGNAALAAPSNPPTPSGRKGVQPPQASARSAASQPASEQRGTAIAPLFVQSVPGAENEEDAAHKKYERREKPSLDRRLTIGTELLAAFTALLFIFTALLWRSTSKLVRDADKSAKQQLRAYIHVTKGSVGWSSNEKIWPRLINVKVDLKNSGVTPARKVVNWCRARAFTGDPVFNRPEADEFDKSIGVLGPGQESHFEFDKSYQFETADEVIACKEGKMKLYVWGEATYVDAFGKDRCTTFRFVMPQNRVYPEGGKLRPCEQGNDYT